ncbi:hypothetical protein E6H29_11205 [Candidatus Bathyarchaeota archaeon]|nr:MAG: hypothetical protein E6H29_11205 [Candidatus Bathyarchaeota archaeon]
MSHDLEIVTSIKPVHFLLEKFIATRNNLTIQGKLGSDAGNVIVYRKERNALVASFEIWGPSKAESEDLEESVVSIVQPPRWVTQISVPAGGEKDDRTSAEELARYISERCTGVVYDPQVAAVTWPKVSDQRPSMRSQKERIRLVKLDWYLPKGQASESMAHTLLRYLREICPEALPVRFGSYEPLQGRIFQCKSPCFAGQIFTPRRNVVKESPILQEVHVSLDFDGRVLQTKGEWCDKIVTLFGELAKYLKAFYACAYIERGVIASRRGLGYDGESEHYPLPRGRWVGVPSTPTWLSWFGGPYKSLVEESLKGAGCESSPEGILVRIGPWPMDLDELQGKMVRLPDELVAKMEQRVKETKTKTTTFRWVDWEATPAGFIPRLD